MEKRPGRGPTLRSGAHRHGVGPIVTVDGLSVRARTDSPALGDVAYCVLRTAYWPGVWAGAPAPPFPSVCVELDYHPVVWLRARADAPHARAESAAQLILPCAWN